MGTISQPMDVGTHPAHQERIHSSHTLQLPAQHKAQQPACAGAGHSPVASSAVAAAAAASSTAPSSGGGGGSGSSAAYWYARAQRAIRQRAADAGQMLREYQHVVALDASIGHSMTAARSRAAASRNRYANVLPYDHNRVVLRGEGAPYLNASHVEVRLPGTPRPCAYIATQGPLPGTTPDFWGMVAQVRPPAVIMLTNVSEAGLAKCAQYFPLSGPGEAPVMVAPGLELQVEHAAPFCSDSTLRRLVLRQAGSGVEHRLDHFHYHAWPDHGTPSSSAGIRAIVAHLGPSRDSGRPVVVHCSAGIGRTGTFIAIDVLLRRLDAWAALRGGCGPDRAEVEDALDVPALVHGLRQQRCGMVQTLEQYVFVYKALLDDLALRVKEGHGGSGGGSGGGTILA